MITVKKVDCHKLEASVAHWQQRAAFIGFAYLELPAAQTHGAKTDTVKLWAQTVCKTRVLPYLLLWAVLPFFLSEQLFSLVFEVVPLSVVDCLPFILFLIIVIICLCLSKNNKSLIKKKNLL